MLNRIFYFLFKKKIDFLAEEKFKSIVLDKYVEDNFFVVNGKSSPELQFQGKKFIKYMAASVYEIVKDAPNYIEMDLTATGYENMTVTIQKTNKLSPHQRAEKLKKENEELRDIIKELIDRIDDMPCINNPMIVGSHTYTYRSSFKDNPMYIEIKQLLIKNLGSISEALAWLQKPNPDWLGLSADQMIKIGKGDKVLDFIKENQEYTGVFN